MRRKEREMSKEFALQVIDDAQFGVLGVIDNDVPYTVPLSIFRDGNALYFHSAKAGKKVDLFKDGTVVSVSFVSHVQVPHFYSHDEVADLIERNKIGVLASSVYTTEFSSARVVGRIYRVEEQEQKERALLLLCEKFTPEIADIAAPVARSGVEYTGIFKIEIDEIYGKRKTFDDKGNELTNGKEQ